MFFWGGGGEGAGLDINVPLIKENDLILIFLCTKVLCQGLKTTQWLKIVSSDGNIKTYVGGWQPCYDLCAVENLEE